MTEGSGQLSFDAGDEAVSVAVPGLRYIADWLDPDACREMLARIEAGAWSTELRRRVQHYGHRYDYGRRAVTGDSRTAATAPPLPPWALQEAVRLAREGVMAQRADQVIVNEYEPGQGISAHVDCVPCFGPVVAAISLGSGCVMDFTHPEEGKRTSVRLAPGSLCVMTGPARYDWRHGIAARKSDPEGGGRVPRGRRVSVTFRTVLGSA
ncbi:alpha-ketoglutarate-dependent dioxygenase AlkB [Streptomyces sp. NPDC021080]|uniref:alpha-ketoglutarate-dependent dioxygenase AlkB n=1 Tax=Streptomyces sp. NPDC021080 TaxID=3365110 RepID=UPI0037ABBE8F